MGRLSEYINGTRKGTRPSYIGTTSGGGGAVVVQAEIDEASFEQVNEVLARLMITHPDTKKRIKKMLQAEAKKVRKNISKDVHNNMPNDPRRAYLAVKRSLYKRILGFNVSILNPRRGSGTADRETRFGNRGDIRTRRVFETSASFQMEGAMNEISQIIEEIMSEEFNNA